MHHERAKVGAPDLEAAFLDRLQMVAAGEKSDLVSRAGKKPAVEPANAACADHCNPHPGASIGPVSGRARCFGPVYLRERSREGWSVLVGHNTHVATTTQLVALIPASRRCLQSARFEVGSAFRLAFAGCLLGDGE